MHPFVRQFANTQGEFKPCCEWDGGEHGSWEWQSDHMRQVRRQFNQRQLPPACWSCRESDLTGDRSLRQFINDQHPDITDHYFMNPTESPPAPRAYDLRMSNRCNLECVFCSPQSSDRIHHSMQNYLAEGHVNQWVSQRDSITASTHTPDQMARVIREHADTCEHVQLAGGEPLIMPEVIHLVEWLVAHDHAHHIDLEFTTNATALRPRWLDEWCTQFRSCQMVCSIDSVGQRQEYHRWPVRWLTQERRIVELHDQWRPLDHCQVSLHVTLAAHTITTLPALIRWQQINQIPAEITWVQTDPRWLRPQRVSRDVRLMAIAEAEREILTKPPGGWDALKQMCDQPQETHTAQDLQELADAIRYWDHTRPMTWREAIPELAHWDAQP